jgi:hypothetical protein
VSTAERAASYRSQKHRRHFPFFEEDRRTHDPPQRKPHTANRRLILGGAASQPTSYLVCLKEPSSLTPKKKGRNLESCGICQGLGVALPLPFCAINSFSPRPRSRPPDLSTAFETQPTNDKHHPHLRSGECARLGGTFNRPYLTVLLRLRIAN